MDIQGSTFIVSGGSSGLGAATVEMVVASGGNAIIADLNRSGGEALAVKLGKQTRFLEVDVTREDHGKAAVELALAAFGGLQGLGGHGQDAGTGITGVGDPAHRLGGEQLHTLCRVQLHEPSCSLSGCPECVAGGLGRAGRRRCRLFRLRHVWCAF